MFLCSWLHYVPSAPSFSIGIVYNQGSGRGAQLPQPAYRLTNSQNFAKHDEALLNIALCELVVLSIAFIALHLRSRLISYN